METLMAVGRFLMIAAGALNKQRVVGDIARIMEYVGTTVEIFGDDKAKFEALNEFVERKVRDQESFTPEDFEAWYDEQDALTDRGDAAARDRGLETSSELSPVGDMNVQDAVAAIATIDDVDALGAILKHDGRKGARDAAQARLDALTPT